MSIEKVRACFQAVGIADRILEFDVSSATVDLAAQAPGCEPCRIAKTLSFCVDGAPILVVMAGNVKVDNAKYKATMLPREDIAPLIGHAVGGVCPFAVPETVQVYLDESLKRFDTVFPACGGSNSAIELSIEELERYSHFADWVNVSKDL